VKSAREATSSLNVLIIRFLFWFFWGFGSKVTSKPVSDDIDRLGFVIGLAGDRSKDLQSRKEPGQGFLSGPDQVR